MTFISKLNEKNDSGLYERGLISLLLLAGAVAASAFRIVIAPGFEFYLGPLFYLIAYRQFGLSTSIFVALAVMSPTIAWWGHPFSIVAAVCHLIFIHRVRGRIPELLAATFVYYLAIGIALNWLFASLINDIPLNVGIIVMCRKVLNDTLLAGIVDCIFLVMTFEISPFSLRLKKSFSLREMLNLVIFFPLCIFFIATFASYANRLPADIEIARNKIDIETKLHLAGKLSTGDFSSGYISLPSMKSQQIFVYASAFQNDIDATSITKLLGCSKIDSKLVTSPTNDKNTFVYLLNTCQMREITLYGKEFFAIYSNSHIVKQFFTEMVIYLLKFSPILLLSLTISVLFAESMKSSVSGMLLVFEGLGKENIQIDPRIKFDEFITPVSSFVNANSLYVSTLNDRLGYIQTLNTAIGLRLVADLKFDNVAGTISFIETNLIERRVHRLLKVHPNDLLIVENISHYDQSFIEIRFLEPENSGWHVLMVRGLLDKAHWKSGCIVRMRQPTATDNRMQHQARLAELGVMASMLNHELKQPLFTIAMAAENGVNLLADERQPRAAKAQTKFARILVQAERASAILERVMNYARVNTPAGESFDLVKCLGEVILFMRPFLISQNIESKFVDETDGPINVDFARVGFEQVIVNGIQNAADAIAQARLIDRYRPAGNITIHCTRDSESITIEIRDDGAGLSTKASADPFEAFVTTKAEGKGTGLGLYISQHIVSEWGGQITLTSPSGAQTGAVLTIRFNLSASHDKQTPTI